jgi:hypothetical protein
MILFEDKDGRKFKIWLRGAYSHIRSQKKLKQILDNSILNQNIVLINPLQSKTYMEVMRYFGMISKSERIIL